MKHLKDQTRQRAAEAGYNGPRCLSHDPVHCGRAWTAAHNCRLVNIGTLVGAVVIGTAGWATFDSWHAAWASIGLHFASQAVFRAWIGGFGLWAPAVYFLAIALAVAKLCPDQLRVVSPGNCRGQLIGSRFGSEVWFGAISAEFYKCL